MKTKEKLRLLIHGGVLGALYVVLTTLQNLIWPGSATMAIQLRLAEALCIFCFFTPAAPYGLALGCMIFNLAWAQSLPLDFALGSLATLLAGLCMYRLRGLLWKGIPALGLLMPALFNGLIIGWELTVFLGPQGFTPALFGLNALYVFIGEAAVLFTCGAVLYQVLCRNGLWRRLLGQPKGE